VAVDIWREKSWIRTKSIRLRVRSCWQCVAGYEPDYRRLADAYSAVCGPYLPFGTSIWRGDNAAHPLVLVFWVFRMDSSSDMSYLQNQNQVVIVKTVFLCDSLIRRKYFLKFGKHQNAEVTVYASYDVCLHLYHKPASVVQLVKTSSIMRVVMSASLEVRIF